MGKQRFVERKIRDGRVKIKGMWMYPNEWHRAYMGELDGMTLVFALYWTGDKLEPFAALVGQKLLTQDDYDMSFRFHPNLIDGVFHWDWWGTHEYIDYINGVKKRIYP